jgi:DNA-binding response OmpR family regulator
VDSAICTLRGKLKSHGVAALIHTRPKLGYVLEGGEA